MEAFKTTLAEIITAVEHSRATSHLGLQPIAQTIIMAISTFHNVYLASSGGNPSAEVAMDFMLEAITYVRQNMSMVGKWASKATHLPRGGAQMPSHETYSRCANVIHPSQHDVPGRYVYMSESDEEERLPAAAPSSHSTRSGNASSATMPIKVKTSSSRETGEAPKKRGKGEAEAVPQTNTKKTHSTHEKAAAAPNPHVIPPTSRMNGQLNTRQAHATSRGQGHIIQERMVASKAGGDGIETLRFTTTEGGTLVATEESDECRIA